MELEGLHSDDDEWVDGQKKQCIPVVHNADDYRYVFLATHFEGFKEQENVVSTLYFICVV